MKRTKCENKHFYDADKYDKCPHCAKNALGNSEEPEKSFSKKGNTHSHTSEHPFFSIKKHTISRQEETLEDERAVSLESYEVDDVKTCSMAEVESYISDSSDVVTVAMQSASSETVSETDFGMTSGYGVEPNSGVYHTVKPSLQSQINAVTSHTTTEDVKTMAFYGSGETEPVVGWLVCVSGEYTGQSFNLKAGQNFIGRALTMDIPLAQDTTVSRNKHAILIYDPQGRVFFIQPGESSGLTYLNGTLLLSYQQLKIYDKVKVGNNELVFIPFCGELFSWDDYIK